MSNEGHSEDIVSRYTEVPPLHASNRSPNLEDAEPGREPLSDEPSPVPADEAGLPADEAGAGDEPAGAPVDVEPAGAPVTLGPPDHLIRHETVEEAYAAMLERNPRHDDYGSLMAAHEARRRDQSARTMHWLSGGDT